MHIIEKHNKAFEYSGILLNLIVAFQFLTIWYQPKYSDIDKIASMATLMAFEFILVHSGVFMAVMPKKIALYILVPLYSLFAYAFSTSTSSNTLLIIYGCVVLNRMRFAFSNVNDLLKTKTILISGLAAIAYVFLIVICVFTNGIFGELGLNEAFLNDSDYFKYITAKGVFIETPHIAIAFGFFYYCTLSIIEALLINKTTLQQTL